MAIPIGSVVMYSSEKAPEDFDESWLLCDGGSQCQTDSGTLFDVIGGSFGQDPDSATFFVPDLVGRFVRSPDSGVEPNSAAGVDPDAGSRGAMNVNGSTGDHVGSIQDESLPEHFHNMWGTWGVDNQGSSPVKANAVLTQDEGEGQTCAQGEADTRPVNVALSFLILSSGPVQRFPIGSMIYYAGVTDPTDPVDGDVWLICDGRAHSGFGGGYLPDCRGRFLRGVDDGMNRDPEGAIRTPGYKGGPAGDVAGTFEDDIFARHAHGLAGEKDVGHEGGSSNQVVGAPAASDDTDWGGTTQLTSIGTGNETRPINAYLNMIVRVS